MTKLKLQTIQFVRYMIVLMVVMTITLIANIGLIADLGWLSGMITAFCFIVMYYLGQYDAKQEAQCNSK